MKNYIGILTKVISLVFVALGVHTNIDPLIFRILTVFLEDLDLFI